MEMGVALECELVAVECRSVECECVTKNVTVTLFESLGCRRTAGKSSEQHAENNCADHSFIDCAFGMESALGVSAWACHWIVEIIGADYMRIKFKLSSTSWCGELVECQWRCSFVNEFKLQLVWVTFGEPATSTSRRLKTEPTPLLWQSYAYPIALKQGNESKVE